MMSSVNKQRNNSDDITQNTGVIFRNAVDSTIKASGTFDSKRQRFVESTK